MQHFDYEDTTTGVIATNFPHTPMDVDQSIRDYLEDKLANGLEPLSLSVTDGGRYIFVFKVVAK